MKKIIQLLYFLILLLFFYSIPYQFSPTTTSSWRLERPLCQYSFLTDNTAELFSDNICKDFGLSPVMFK